MTPSREQEIAARVAEVRQRIAAAAARAGRSPETVTLLAVTKNHPLSDALAAYAAGVRHFGENRVQEAATKLPLLPPDAVPHLIGPIQSNKANRAAELARVVQALDSAELAGRLARAAERLGKTLDVFAEVNLGGEASKAGVVPSALPPLLEAIRALPALSLRGLMAIPPPGDTRPFFGRLAELAARAGLPELSMGMSDDYEAAVEEGSTLVRIGTAIFGAR